ncbi:hypothetical protein ACOMHN_034442 [Nucella lapillus]
MAGKRGCSLKLAFLLHAGGFVMLMIGCLTPYWSRVQDVTSGKVVYHQGLLVNYVPDNDWTFRDFNTLKKAGSDTSILYLTLSISFGILVIFFEFFLLEAFAFVLYNASCGKKYHPDYLMVFSLLTGLMAVVSLILYEQFTGRSFNDSTDVKLDFSRGFVVIYIAASFLSAFFMVCDRSSDQKK